MTTAMDGWMKGCDRACDHTITSDGIEPADIFDGEVICVAHPCGETLNFTLPSIPPDTTLTIRGLLCGSDRNVVVAGDPVRVRENRHLILEDLEIAGSMRVDDSGSLTLRNVVAVDPSRDHLIEVRLGGTLVVENSILENRLHSSDATIFAAGDVTVRNSRVRRLNGGYAIEASGDVLLERNCNFVGGQCLAADLMVATDRGLFGLGGAQVLKMTDGSLRAHSNAMFGAARFLGEAGQATIHLSNVNPARFDNNHITSVSTLTAVRISGTTWGSSNDDHIRTLQQRILRDQATQVVRVEDTAQWAFNNDDIGIDLATGGTNLRRSVAAVDCSTTSATCSFRGGSYSGAFSSGNTRSSIGIRCGGCEWLSDLTANGGRIERGGVVTVSSGIEVTAGTVELWRVRALGGVATTVVGLVHTGGVLALNDSFVTAQGGAATGLESSGDLRVRGSTIVGFFNPRLSPPSRCQGLVVSGSSAILSSLIVGGDCAAAVGLVAVVPPVLLLNTGLIVADRGVDGTLPAPPFTQRETTALRVQFGADYQPCPDNYFGMAGDSRFSAVHDLNGEARRSPRPLAVGAQEWAAVCPTETE